MRRRISVLVCAVMFSSVVAAVAWDDLDRQTESKPVPEPIAIAVQPQPAPPPPVPPAAAHTVKAVSYGPIRKCPIFPLVIFGNLAHYYGDMCQDGVLLGPANVVTGYPLQEPAHSCLADHGGCLNCVNGSGSYVVDDEHLSAALTEYPGHEIGVVPGMEKPPYEAMTDHIDFLVKDGNNIRSRQLVGFIYVEFRVKNDPIVRLARVIQVTYNRTAKTGVERTSYLFAYEVQRGAAAAAPQPTPNQDSILPQITPEQAQSGVARVTWLPKSTDATPLVYDRPLSFDLYIKK